MRTTIKLKKSCTVKNLLSPDEMFDLDLPIGTEVTHDRHAFDQGDVHVITYKDGNELYQAVRFVPKQDDGNVTLTATQSTQCQDEDGCDGEGCPEPSYDDAEAMKDLPATYAHAQSLPPVPATPTHSDLDALASLGGRELVLYRSKSGALGRYVVVRRFSRRQGGGRTFLITLRAADFVSGTQFTVRADSVERLEPHATSAPTPDQNPGQPAPQGDDPFGGSVPISGTCDGSGRPTFTLEVSQINLTAGYLTYNGWPQSLECDVDGSGVRRGFRFVELGTGADDEVMFARYRNDQADLLIVND